MTQYEQILDKISPVFFKTLQYYDYFYNHYVSVSSYLEHINIPDIHTNIFIPPENINYFYYSFKHIGSHHIAEKTEGGENIILSTKDKVENIVLYGVISLDQFIVNTVINNFSYENKHIYVNSVESYKDLFIALVGKEMYDAIRENIK